MIIYMPAKMEQTTTQFEYQRKEEVEKRQQEEAERKAGFYEQEKETTAEAWDVRKDTRAMKNMDID